MLKDTKHQQKINLREERLALSNFILKRVVQVFGVVRFILQKMPQTLEVCWCVSSQTNITHVLFYIFFCSNMHTTKGEARLFFGDCQKERHTTDSRFWIR